jgi:hypothetical protein
VAGAGGTPVAAAAAAAAGGSSAAAMAAAVGGLLLSGPSRTPFILRCMGPTSPEGYGGGVGGSGSSRRGSSSGYLGGVGVDQDGGSGLPELPPSQVYKLSCEYFSRPMLEPQVRGDARARGGGGCCKWMV